MATELCFGIAMVKDEADVIGPIVEHMLDEVDEIIVADNGSTDATREILAELPVTVIDDPDPAYFQSRKMSQLAELAREKGATWVVPFDADEWWTSTWGRIGDVLSDVTADFGIVRAELFDHVCTALDPSDPDPIRRIQWRRTKPLELPKVAAQTCEGLVIEQGNHWARHPIPARATDKARLTVHHFPYRSVEQIIRKVRNGAAAYAATDLPDNIGAHWRQWGRFTDAQIEDLFHAWYFREQPMFEHTNPDGTKASPLVHDPVV